MKHPLPVVLFIIPVGLIVLIIPFVSGWIIKARIINSAAGMYALTGFCLTAAGVLTVLGAAIISRWEDKRLAASRAREKAGAPQGGKAVYPGFKAIIDSIDLSIDRLRALNADIHGQTAVLLRSHGLSPVSPPEHGAGPLSAEPPVVEIPEAETLEPATPVLETPGEETPEEQPPDLKAPASDGGTALPEGDRTKGKTVYLLYNHRYIGLEFDIFRIDEHLN
jgi:hypothetical protein